LALLFSGVAANALEPANPDANPKARAIFHYLQGLSQRTGKRLVSGQFTGFGRGTSLRVTDKIHDQTGQWPALMGTDYADFEHGSLNSKAPNQAAIQYWQAGGLVTISAHLYNPANPRAAACATKALKACSLRMATRTRGGCKNWTSLHLDSRNSRTRASWCSGDRFTR
jgi:hypothetical protein